MKSAFSALVGHSVIAAAIHLVVLGVLLASFLVPSGVYADTVNFNFTGTLASSGPVTGQFTLDTASATITAFDFTTPFSEVDPANLYVPLLFQFTQFAPPGESFIELAFLGNVPAANSLILWFQTSLTGFTSGPTPVFIGLPSEIQIIGLETDVPSSVDCTATPPFAPCTSPGSEVFVSGQATPVPTLEPSTLAMLGTLLIGLASVVCLQRR